MKIIRKPETSHTEDGQKSFSCRDFTVKADGQKPARCKGYTMPAEEVKPARCKSYAVSCASFASVKSGL